MGEVSRAGTTVDEGNEDLQRGRQTWGQSSQIIFINSRHVWASQTLFLPNKAIDTAKQFKN